MLGYVADIAFYNVPDQSGIVGLNWRLMLGSAALPPIAVMILVFMSPESPRWYLSKNRYEDAYKAMLRLRKTPLRAARDTYAAYEGVLAERALNASRSRNVSWRWSQRHGSAKAFRALDSSCLCNNFAESTYVCITTLAAYRAFVTLT